MSAGSSERGRKVKVPLCCGQRSPLSPLEEMPERPAPVKGFECGAFGAEFGW